MKKYVLMLIAILVIVVGLFGSRSGSRPGNDPPWRDGRPHRILVGRTGSAGCRASGVSSPNEVIARLANGELDMAALPTNVAANLYNKGSKSVSPRSSATGCFP